MTSCQHDGPVRFMWALESSRLRSVSMCCLCREVLGDIKRDLALHLRALAREKGGRIRVDMDGPEPVYLVWCPKQDEPPWVPDRMPAEDLR